MHSHMRWTIAAAGFALFAAMPAAQARQGAAPPAGAQPAAPQLDPVALQALRSMGAYLKTLKSFEIRSKAAVETNLPDTDLKVTLGLDNLYRVQRPNRFFVQVRSDRQHREYYYDGKDVTVSVPRQKVYARVAAPATIAAVVQDLYDNYDIALPLSDLFTWADLGAPTDGITSAVRVGFAKVGSADADQFAYRGDFLDFQVWIARGAQPLPLRIAISDRRDTARPTYTADLTWNTAARFKPADFAFTPDGKATSIRLARYAGREN